MLGPASADQDGLLGQCPDSLEPTEGTEELKPLSSEEEEEEEEEEEGGEEGHAPQSRSILPLSVLDQASIIAERFTSNLSRRSSLALEEGKGFLTPKQASQCGSALSLDGSETATCRNGSTADSQAGATGLPPEAPAAPIAVPSGAASLGLLETDRTACRRKESMLSQQDRLLLNKIKSYYDYAEHQDASFSVKRRESLSYIPKGLVRNSVFRINSLPQPEPGQDVLKRKRLGSTGSSGAGRTAAWVLSNRPAVQPQAAPSDASCAENPITDAEFRPSGEMVKVWEEMEKPRKGLWSRRVDSGTRTGMANGPAAAAASPQHMERPMKDRLKDQENGFDLHEPLLILEDEDLGAIAEESAVPSPESKSPVERAAPSRWSWRLGHCEQERGLPSLHPHIMQLAGLTEAELMEKLSNKVYHLARQYSLRIKGHKPPVHRGPAEVEEMNSGASTGQLESEKKGKGKWKPTLSLFNYEQVVLQEASPVALLSSSSSSSLQKSPKRFSFSPCASSPHLISPTSTLSHSPISPVVAEKFSWPDVRELRSKYSCQNRAEKGRPLPVNRSRSAPEKMMDAERMPADQQHPKRNVNAGAKSQEGVVQNSRGKGSLDSVLKDHSFNAHEELRVTAEASLENNQRVIVTEKLLDGTGELDESYVQIRSPTSREKISLKAVVERCKAYQDSEEYRRHEQDFQDVSPQKALRQDLWEKTDNSQQSLVKNLREKFQTLNSIS
ncbi:Pleckstrin-likey domain-containing family G member 3 [Varanus komodoensis]|nr:Pleckstrin-likey domain-containing family G member 3 [Varanus komodoensis]